MSQECVALTASACEELDRQTGFGEAGLRILILGLNFAPERVGIAVYTSGLAYALATRGHDVRVVAGKPYYPSWQVPNGYEGWLQRRIEAGVEITRVAHFVPRRPTGTLRILHHLSFALSCFLPLLMEAVRRKPDLILAVSPCLMSAPIALFAARLTGVRTWLHVQDLEVEAAAAAGLLGNARFLKAALGIEKYIFRRFDRVSTISAPMIQKLEEKGVARDRSVILRNWADLEHVKPGNAASSFRGEWQIEARFVALYSGNIANKQGLEIIVDAAHHLRHRSDLLFVICGNGPYRQALEDRAAGAPNVMFQDLQPANRLGELLSLATLHVLPQVPAMSDLVLPSKLGNMLASGRPIVATAYRGTGLANEVESCGVVVPPGDEQALAGAIDSLLNDPARMEALAATARQRAEKFWNREDIISTFERLIKGDAALNRRSAADRRG